MVVTCAISLGCTKSRSVPCEVRDFNQLQGSSPSDGLSELGILGKRTVLLPVGLAFGFVAATEIDCLPNHSIYIYMYIYIYCIDIIYPMYKLVLTWVSSSVSQFSPVTRCFANFLNPLQKTCQPKKTMLFSKKLGPSILVAPNIIG